MEKVFLRVYNCEIASMIEGGHLDEAVAHCQHILKTFPMHIETYRLLGKAFLEGRRYTDAADIFQRILMSVPDDFVSQVGMSVIRDNEGRLDDVIWHMERAFEVQPSNSAIQGELRRLYGRRDGVEPPKIRLSRDALANMYLQGELFNQAIAEIRSILAEDPNRPDLQVMLLRAYYNSGQKVEASEMAATLLKKYHYCMDALRVLVDVLPDAKSAENTQVYRRRLYLLDPYSSFAIDSVFASDQVADSAVDLERLDYKASAMPGTSQTDQTSSPGIKMNTEKRTEPAPDSLQTSETVEPSGAVIPEPSGVGATAAEGTVADSVPDANRPSGHLDSTGKTKDGSADTGNALPEKPIAKPIIPDWLMPMAPTEIVEKANTMSEESSKSLPAGDDGFPDWFTLVAALEGAEGAQVESQGIISSPEGGKDINPIAPVEPAKEALMKPQESLEPQPASGEDVPDSLRTIAPVETAPETLITHPEPVKPQGESTLPAEATGTSNIVSEPTLPNVPPKESEAEPVPAATPSADEKPFPDWLTGMGTAVAVAIPSAAEAIGNPAEGGQPIAEQPVSEQAVAEQPVPEQSIPEKSVSEQAVTEQSVPEQPVSEQTVADQPVAEQAVLEQPVSEQSVTEQSIPEQAISEQPVLEPLVPEQSVVEQPVPEQSIPEQPVSEQAVPEQIIPDQSISEQAVAEQPILEQPVPEQSIPEQPVYEQPISSEPTAQELVTPLVTELVRNPAETLPLEALGGLSAGTSASTSDQPIEQAIPVQEEVPPAPESPAGTATQPAIQTAKGEEDMMAWLERLSADRESTPEVPLVSPEGNLEAKAVENQEMPDEQPTVQATGESVPIPIPTEPAEKVEGATGKTSTELPQEEKPAAPVEELPDWLKGFESPTTPVGTPNAGDNLPMGLPQPVTGGEELPDFLKFMAASEVGGKALAEPQEPVEPQPASGEAIQESQESTVPVEATSSSNVVAEAMLPVASDKGTEAEPSPAATPSADEKPFPDWLTGMGTAVAVAIPSAAEAIGNPAEGGQPIAEQPVPEQSIPEKSVSEQAVTEQSVPEQPVSEQTVADQPVAEQAVLEQPVSEQSVTEQSIPEQAISEQPVLEPLVPEQSVVEQPVPEQSIPEQPVSEQPVPEQIIPDQSISEQAVAEQPILEQPVVEQPVSGHAVSEQPALGLPIPEQAVSEQPVSKQAVAEQPVLDQPVPEQPIPEQPVSEQLVSEQAVSKQSLPEQPIRSESAVQEEVKSPISTSGTVGESSQPLVDGKPLTIGDGALGWLESMAVKQGAKPEELLTNPQDSPTEKPDWLRQLGEGRFEPSIVPVQEPVNNSPETLPLEPMDGLSAGTSASTSDQPIEEAIPVQKEVPPPSEPPTEIATQPAIQPVKGEEDIIPGLERQSFDQGTIFEAPLVRPEENPETTPVVNQEISDEQPAVQTAEESVPVPTPTGPAEKVEEAAGKTQTELPHEETPAAPVEELPDWLNRLESSTTPVEIPKPADDMPEWLRHPIASGKDVPDFLKSAAATEVAGGAFVETQEPVEPQQAGGEAIQESQELTVLAEAAGSSNVVSEATLPEVAGEESGLELAPAETTFSDIEALPDRLKGMATYVAEAAPSAAETMGQPAESGQITAEQPVTEQPALGQPVPEQPISEQAVSEQPVLEQPVLEQPVPEQAISEQPVLEQPVLEQPVPGQPVSERPVLEQPVLEQPVPEQVISEQPILEQPVLEQPVLEQPVPEQVISEQPVPEQPVPEQPVLEQPISEQAVAEQPVPEQPVPEQPIPEQPFSEQAVTEQPVLEQPFPEQPIPEQTVIEQPIPEQPLPEQPIRSESAAQEEVKPMISEPAGNPLETLPPETVGVLSVGPSPSTSGQPIEEAIPVQAEVPPPSESPVKTVTKKVVQPEMEEEDWVKGLETPTTLGETSKTDDDSLGWLRGLETPATPVYTPKVRKDSSKRRCHPISPEELESVSEPETSTWGDENIPVTGQTIPTLPEEWVPAEAKLDAGLKPAPIPETAPVEENLPPAGYEPPSETIPVSKSKQAVKSEPVTKSASIPVQRPTHPTTWKQTGKFSDVPAKDKDAELLSSAQTYLDQKSLNESMDQYSKLIKKGHLLDEVIYDLREGIHRYPVDVNIWQTLGDAYMRANRLQDALDAYTKAEELLR